MNPKIRLLGVVVAASALLAAYGCGDDQPSEPSVTREPNELSRDEQRRFEALTIEQIMPGPGIVGTSPSNPRFSADGLTVYFEWNSPVRLDSLNAASPNRAYENYLDLEHEAGTWALDVASGRSRPLTAAEADTLAPGAFAWDSERRRRVEVRGGDVYLVDTSAGSVRRVTGTLTSETGVQISPDGALAYFVRDNNLFRVRWSGGPAEQVTDIRAANDPDEFSGSDQRRYLADQQKELFAEFRERDEPDDGHRPGALYVGDGFDVEGIEVSPSGRYVSVALSKDPSGTRRPIVPLVITESGYIETEETRAKVGEAQSESRVAVIDLEADSLLWVEADETLWVTPLSWSPHDDVLLVRGVAADWHDRYFYLVAPGEGASDGKLELREIDHYHDDAWVGGPEFYRTGDWRRDGSGIYFISEEDGFAHLYSVESDGTKRQLTTGGWEVQGVQLDTDRGCWYLLSNKGRAASSRLWRMPIDGGELSLLTPELGGYEAIFSGDMRRAAVLRSSTDHPTELYVLDAGRDDLQGPFTESATESFRSFAWATPKDVTFPASDGERLSAHVFTPDQFGAKSNGAGVIFIHGAGYLQNVTDSWSYYYREYMFNNLLASRGYTVINVDYRGSAGYGQACRTAIHKHMGGRDLSDIVDAARYLQREHGIGKDQVGVYGGSYGGFLTLMALFQHPDVFAAGAALRSVTDWSHYNHWYTSRILGIPTEDPGAYRRSSPIYFADGLEGHLLMLHGLRDSNVLAADILRLSQRLIELGKDDWELALHPAEAHAYQRASSWTDQMTRAYKLFEEVLPDGARKRR